MGIDLSRDPFKDWKTLRKQFLTTLCKNILYRGHSIHLIEKGDIFFIQVQLQEQCVDTKEWYTAKGRKYYISDHMIEAEVVQTALMAVLAFEEHEARERFTYKGKRLFGPHICLDALSEASGKIVGRVEGGAL